MYLFFGTSSRLTRGNTLVKLGLHQMTALNHLRAHRHHHHHNGHTPRPLSCT